MKILKYSWLRGWQLFKILVFYQNIHSWELDTCSIFFYFFGHFIAFQLCFGFVPPIALVCATCPPVLPFFCHVEMFSLSSSLLFFTQSLSIFCFLFLFSSSFYFYFFLRFWFGFEDGLGSQALSRRRSCTQPSFPFCAWL